MKYTVIVIFTYDGKDEKRSVDRYENFDDALARFHSVFGYISNKETKTIMSVILNNQGNIMRSEYWERKIVEEQEHSTVTEPSN